MTTPPKNHRRLVAFALAGLALVGGGLSLAVLSNPKRFSINVADDRYIQLFALSGFACTLVGILLFLYAIRNTTNSMAAHLQRNANIGVGLGFVLQLGGFFLPEVLPVTTAVGWALVLAGIPAFVWAGMNYAMGKGYSKSLGLLAIIGILGFIVLILLPHQQSEPSPVQST